MNERRRIRLPSPGTSSSVVTLPSRVAGALAPEQAIPTPEHRVTNYGSIPYVGEDREEREGNATRLIKPVEAILVTLSRPWPLVGFGIDPGDLPVGGAPNQIVARLYALTRAGRWLVATLTVSGGPPTQGLVSTFVGARPELAVFIPATIAPGTVNRVKGSLWGSTLYR